MSNYRPPKLPQLLDRKIYKTGQTRGADDDVIFQNRVLRSSTVLIPYELWDEVYILPDGEAEFENGFIALIRPHDYFTTPNIVQKLEQRGLFLSKNALVFYQKRSDWDEFNPESRGWTPAKSRTEPLNGEYVARVAATTASESGGKISRGYNTTGTKGAGIRLYEYASGSCIKDCRLQLEAVFWLCADALDLVIEFEMGENEAIERREYSLNIAKDSGLLDFEKLIKSRVIDKNNQTICPLCLEPLSSRGFFQRMPQAIGREVHDLTVTEINLFHIDELRYGSFNHRPYNVGWGHHHCNVVVKDSGIDETLKWMKAVIERNNEIGI